MIAAVSQSAVHIASDSGLGTGFFIQDVSAFYGVESADKVPERFTALNSRFVLTNYHVVEGDREVMIRHPNWPTVLLGVVIAVEPVRDLAILQVCCFRGRLAQWDPGLTWGDASRIRPGDEVFAIGYLTADVDTEATVTKGIVSSVLFDDERQARVIQTDAPINPGNSGGPLVSRTGRVLGVNTYKRVHVSVEGVGFAVSGETILPNLASFSTEIPVDSCGVACQLIEESRAAGRL